MGTLGPLLGMLERVDREMIGGWAADASDPAKIVELEVLIDEDSAGTLPARVIRGDLRNAGLGDGAHGFVLRLPPSLSGAAHVLRLRRVGDGAELPGSPRHLPAIAGDQVKTDIGASLDAAAARATAAELDALIAGLARRAAELLIPRGAEMTAPEQALIARWAELPAAAKPARRRQALFIDEGVPDARRDAGANAAISHMRGLQRLGYSVAFTAAFGMARGAASAALEALGISCWHAPWVGSVEEVLRRLGPELEVVYLHRFGLMQRYAALVRRWAPQARLLYCVADLHHLREARQAAVEAGKTLDEAVFDDRIGGLRTAELLAVLGADATITHSSHERDLLAAELPEANVHLVAWEVALQPVQVPMAARAGIGFIGSYGHAPNLDAAMTLLREVMPLVWTAAPDVPCRLAGSDMPAALRVAAEAADGPVEVLGQVARAHDLWDRVRLAVAPLRFGAGLKGKVLDSLAAGIPCLCSPMAAEGMDLPDELRAALLCETPAAMAQAILRLHGDAAELRWLSDMGLAWVGATLSAERIAENLGQAIVSS